MNIKQASELSGVTIACIRSRIARGVITHGQIEAANTAEEIKEIIPPTHAGPRRRKGVPSTFLSISECARQVKKSVWAFRRLVARTGAPFERIGRNTVIAAEKWHGEWQEILGASETD